MTSNKFILNKPELDFFFKPKGGFKSLVCGSLESGTLKPHTIFEFNESGKIKSEIGYKKGWTAYPPGTIPPAPVQYLRKYTYKNNILELVVEEDKQSKEQLKSYAFTYHNKLLSKIIETENGSNEYSSKHTKYEYDVNGHLSTEKFFVLQIENLKKYITTEIIRNANSQIVKIMNSNSTEHKEELTTKQEISTYDIEYRDNEIIKKYSSPKHDKTYTTTAKLSASNSNLIASVQYPSNFQGKLKVDYEYDECNQNLIKKLTSYKNRSVTEIYNYK